eukprot:scaffold15968_cov46-Cyclotella_meneghiniana.AAC.1
MDKARDGLVLWSSILYDLGTLAAPLSDLGEQLIAGYGPFGKESVPSGYKYKWTMPTFHPREKM